MGSIILLVTRQSPRLVVNLNVVYLNGRPYQAGLADTKPHSRMYILCELLVSNASKYLYFHHNIGISNN